MGTTLHYNKGETIVKLELYYDVFVFVLVLHSDCCVRVPDISARQPPQVHGEPGEAGDLVG